MNLNCTDCLTIFKAIGDAFNSPLESQEVLESICEAIVKTLNLKGCHFRLLSRDQKILEHLASYGLSDEFLNKGPVDAERSVAEALEGKTVLITDATEDPRIQYPEAHKKEGIVTVLTVPLWSRGQVIGVMRLSTSEKRFFTQRELDIINVVASFATSFILHDMFHNILMKVTETVRSSLDIDEVLQKIVKVITEELRIRGATIRLLDPERKVLMLRAAYGLSEQYLEKGPVLIEKSISEVLEGECVLILDATNDPRVQYPDEARKEGISSILSIPLMIRNQVIGVLRIYTNKPYEFSEDEIYLMKSVGEQCALAIRNAQMYTSVKNRYDMLMSDFHQWFDQFYSSPVPTE